MDIQSVKSFQEYNEERFTKRIIFKKGDSTAFVLNFLPGQQLPAHKHPGSEVFLYVLCGNGKFTIDGNEKAVEEYDLFHCSGEEELTFVNNGDSPLSLYVVLSKIPSDLYAKNV